MKKISMLIIFIILIAAMVIFKLGSFKNEENLENKKILNSNELTKLTVSSGKSIIVSLLDIAQSEGFFEKEGLDLEITYYNSGAESIKAMFEDKQNLSICAHNTMVNYAMERNDFKTIASIGKNNNISGILVKKPIDGKDFVFEGKNINVIPKTATEKFLNSYLEKNHIDKNNIVISSYNIDEAIEKLKTDEIDGVVLYEPIMTNYAKKLGRDYQVIKEKGLYTVFAPINVKTEFLNKNQETLKKFVIALNKASDYYYKNETIFEKKIENFTGMSIEKIRPVLNETKFSIELDMGMLIACEIEAKYLINLEEKSTKKIPNFNNYFYVDILKEVAPNRVNIIN
jgi:ABC-type nitrate/sulfonate/bicarbonate transport system substrate-binding protein